MFSFFNHCRSRAKAFASSFIAPPSAENSLPIVSASSLSENSSLTSAPPSAENSLPIVSVSSSSESSSSTSASPVEIQFAKVQAYFTQAITYFKAGNHNKAYESVLLGMEFFSSSSEMSHQQLVDIFETFREWVRIYQNISAFPTPSDKMDYDWVEEGARDLLKGQPELALKKGKIAVRNHPCHPGGYYICGRSYHKLNKLQEAYLHFHITIWLCHHAPAKGLKNNLKRNEDLFQYSLYVRNMEISLGKLKEAEKTHARLKELSLAYGVIKEKDEDAFSEKLLIKAKELSFDHDYENALHFATASARYSQSTDKKKFYAHACLFAAKLYVLLGDKSEAENVLTIALGHLPTHYKMQERLRLYTKSIPSEKKDESKEIKAVPTKKTNPLPTTKKFVSARYVFTLEEIRHTELEKEGKRKELMEAQRLEEIEKENRRIEREKAEAERKQALQDKKVRDGNKQVRKNLQTQERRKNKHKQLLESKPPTKKVNLSSQSILTLIAPREEKKDEPIIKESKNPIVNAPEPISHFLDANEFPVICNIALQPFEREIVALLNHQCCLVGSTPRERVRQKLAKMPTIFDMKQDRDFVTTASHEQIMKSLEKYNIQPTRKEGLYRFKASDQHDNEFEIQIYQSPHKTVLEDVQGRDYTVNGFLVFANGSVIDPTGRGLQDLKENRLVSIAPMDPWKAVRGKELAEKNNMTIDPELENRIRKNISQLQNMKTYFSIYSWLLKSFSVFGTYKDNAMEKFNFLIKNNLLQHLFHPDSADKLLHDREWVLHQLQDDALVSLQQIYMVFFVSIAAQTFDTGKIDYQKHIYRDNPILADALSGFSRFRLTYNGMMQARADFLARQTETHSYATMKM